MIEDKDIDSEWGIGIMFSFWPLDSLGALELQVGGMYWCRSYFLEKHASSDCALKGTYSKELEES